VADRQIELLRILRRRSIAFVSLSDNLDLSTASGRLMFNIIGAMAEFERALIQERVRAGIRNARAKGNRLEESVPPKCDQQAWDRH
jgi:DNA invertase Pin-like site-specific DNA recombinase